MSLPVFVRRAAELDVMRAEDWYEAQRPGLGHEFREAVDATIARIAENPLAYPDRYHGGPPRSRATLPVRPLVQGAAGSHRRSCVCPRQPRFRSDGRPTSVIVGWRSLRGGAAEGPLVAGCLETVCWHLKGSPDCFVDVSSPPFIDAHLTDLARLGVLEQVAALVFGRPYGYRDRDLPALWELIVGHTARSGIPVLANVDCGHTDPMLTLPLGARARMDAGAGEFRLLETATAGPAT